MFCFIKLKLFLFFSVLNCEPSIKGTKKLIDELNKANGLYKFVRVMRRKFREAVTPGMSMTVDFHTYSSFFMHKMGMPMPRFISTTKILT